MLVSATFHDCAIFMAFLLLVPTLRPETCSTLTPIFSAIIGRMWSRTPKRKRHPTYCRPSTNEHHLLFLIYGWQVKTTCTSVTSTYILTCEPSCDFLARCKIIFLYGRLQNSKDIGFLLNRVYMYLVKYLVTLTSH